MDEISLNYNTLTKIGISRRTETIELSTVHIKIPIAKITSKENLECKVTAHKCTEIFKVQLNIEEIYPDIHHDLLNPEPSTKKESSQVLNSNIENNLLNSIPIRMLNKNINTLPKYLASALTFNWMNEPTPSSNAEEWKINFEVQESSRRPNCFLNVQIYCKRSNVIFFNELIHFK